MWSWCLAWRSSSLFQCVWCSATQKFRKCPFSTLLFCLRMIARSWIMRLKHDCCYTQTILCPEDISISRLILDTRSSFCWQNLAAKALLWFHVQYFQLYLAGYCSCCSPKVPKVETIEQGWVIDTLYDHLHWAGYTFNSCFVNWFTTLSALWIFQFQRSMK